MKHQVLFSLKDKSKNIKVSLAAVLLGSLRAINHVSRTEKKKHYEC